MSASLINSVVTASISTVLSLVLAVPAAYAITRYETPSGRVFIIAALVTRMVPTVAVGVPLVTMMRTLGLTDTSFGLAHRAHHDLAAAVDLAHGELLRSRPRRP